MNIRITDLRNFLELSVSPTIVQAASKLQISQPALSESLKRLESDLKYPLFYRSHQGIRLTPNGRLFQNKARTVIRALEDLEDSDKEKSPFEGRTIAIGCHPVVAQYCLPKALSFLNVEAPDFKVNLLHNLSRNILNEIQLGRIDVGVVINPANLPDLVIREVAADTIGIWTAKGSKKYSTVICEQDLFQTQSILKRWKQKPEKIIQTSSIELMCHLVAENVGCGIIPKRAVLLSGLDLQMSSGLPVFQDRICIAHRPEFGKSAAEKLTLQALRQSFGHVMSSRSLW